MNIELLKKIWSKRKTIIKMGIIGFIVSLAYSLILPAKYKSNSTIYPSNLGSYSDETTTDQLMEFLNSYEVKEILRKKFHLYEHYKLDSTSEQVETQFLRVFESNFSIESTKFGSIEIAVLDKEPKMAQKLVFGMIDAVNQHIRNAKNEKIAENVENSRVFYESRKKRMDSVDALLREFNDKYGINSYGDRIGNATKYYYKSIPEGRFQALEQKLDSLEAQGIQEQWKERKTKVWSNQYNIYLGDYDASRQEYDKGSRDLNKKISFVTVVSRPILPDTRHSPKRSLIVLAGTFATLFFASLYVLLEERVRSLKAKIMNQ